MTVRSLRSEDESAVPCKPRVLVVEDDAGLNRLVCRELGRVGIETEAVGGGNECLAFLERDRVDLLVVDYRLPDMDAAQIVTRLAERKQLPPFVVMTGHGDQRLAVKMMKLGARDYIVKEGDFLEALPHVVRRVYDTVERERRLEETEHALRVRAHESKVLLQGAQAVLEGEDFTTTAHALFDMCRELTGAKSGYVALLNDDGSENEVLFLEAGGMPCTVDPALPMPIRGLRAEAYRTREPVYNNDFANSAWMKFMPPGHVRLDNVLFAPLVIKEKAVGLMGMANKPGDFGPDDARAAGAFSELAAIALKNSRAHEELTRSESRYRSIFEGAASIIAIIDASGIIVDCNRKIRDHLGYKPPELIGRHIECVVSPSSRKKAQANLAKVLKSEAMYDQEYRLVAKDGTLVEVNVNASVLSTRREEGDHILCIIDNITERKRSERELRRAHGRLKSSERRLRASNERIRAGQEAVKESEMRYRGLFEGSVDGIGVADCNTGRLKLANPAWCEMLGYTPAEVGALSIDDIHPREELERLREQFRAQAEGRVRLARNTPCLRKDGVVVYCDINAVPLRVDGRRCLVGFFRDVTARHEAEERIRDMARFPQENPQPVLRTDKGGVLLYANPAADALLEEWKVAIGEKVPLMWSEVVDTAVQSGERKCMEIGAAGRSYSFLVVPVVETGYVNLYGRDITDERRAEEERAKLEEQYRQAQKMESIGQLAGGVAHDFNNILGGIMGYADVLKMHLENNEEYTVLLRKITDAATRAANLTSQLLTFARKASVNMTEVDMGSVLTQVADILGQTIDRRIEIAIRHDGDLGPVSGDRNQLVNALLNLGINARDAMPGGGTLTYETTAVTLASDALLAEGFEVEPGPYMKISVIDTGQGMADDTRARIFEPFFTTKEQGKGTGLGLASVYGCVKQHDGYITVDSEPDRGTAFHVYLPVSRDHDPETEPDSLDEGGMGSGHILLVDDEQMIRETTHEILVELGYEVTECADGLEGVEQFTRLAPSIDAVVLDLIMPKMGGLECYRAMRKSAPNIPVIVATGYGTSQEEAQIIREGVDGFVRKPYGKREIARALAEVLQTGVGKVTNG